MGVRGTGPDCEQRSEPTVLVVDDDAALRRACIRSLEPHASVTAVELTDGAVVDRSTCDVLVLGLAARRETVATWLAGARAASIPVIAIADPEDAVGSTVDALRSGAHSAVASTIASTIDGAELVRAVLDAIETVAPPTGPDLGMVGASPAIRAVRAAIRRAGQATGVPVLIQGESGTGKELVARALHSAAAPNDPFVAVNCAALTETLLEAELFGYEPGAFTGASCGRSCRAVPRGRRRRTAVWTRSGRWRASMQAKLLRVLQERAVRPVGSETDEGVCMSGRRVDESPTRRSGRARRVPARPLLPPQRVHDRGARPARARQRTSARWRGTSCRDAATRFDRATPRFSRDATRRRSARMRGRATSASCATSSNKRCLAQPAPRLPRLDLGLAVATVRPLQGRDGSFHSRRVGLRDAEAALIELVIRETGGNVSQAARRLGINRSTLYAKLREFGIARVDSV